MSTADNSKDSGSPLHGDSRTPMIVAALGLKIERGPGDTVKLTQGDQETLLSRKDWERIIAAVGAAS